jgi:phosphopantothenoylcysteine decarboxylase/phosphopantothenate--cysteine ligase
MGYALAEVLARRGARVTLISGPVNLQPPAGVDIVQVQTALQMKKAIDNKYRSTDAIIMAAAVADYKPGSYSRQKIKKSDVGSQLSLTPNPDILKTLGTRKGKKILAGFALETENLEAAAKRKLLNKKLDMIIANNPTEKGIEFGSDYNRGVIIVKGKKPIKLPTMTKYELADKIGDELIKLLKSKKK